MGEIAVKVENLGKRYRLGQRREAYGTLRDTLVNVARAPLGRMRRAGAAVGEPGTLWALRDVSLEIRAGEVVGIIGRNGAGKSTLLKVLTRITEPTTGYAELHGRAGALLEVGTGFHPELSGRENIYLNGAILGMRKSEIDRKFDEIVAFAEVEKFLDTPVKRYSSGMHVRLAFAVAAHLEPEILLVDEVLAVGDAAFQKKCLGKMGEVAKEGRTVLFVSHNMQAVTALTHRTIMLAQGVCIADGPTSEVIPLYLRDVASAVQVYTEEPSPLEPRVTRVEVRTSKPGNVQQVSEPLELRFRITTPGPVDGAALSFQIFTALGVPAVHLLTMDSELPMCREAGTYELVCHIPKLRLYIGQYTLTVHFSERPGGRKFQTIEGICPFEVVAYGQMRDYYWAPGTSTYLEECEWQVKMLS